MRPTNFLVRTHLSTKCPKLEDLMIKTLYWLCTEDKLVFQGVSTELGTLYEVRSRRTYLLLTTGKVKLQIII